MDLRNKRVFLTGASGGIGRQIALQLAGKGARVALVGRRLEALQKIQREIKQQFDGDTIAISADLSSNGGRREALDQMRAEMGGIDLLINNAGVVDFHDFSDQDPAMIDCIYQTNLVAPVQLTRQVLPEMQQQGHGRIVNIGSTFGSIGFAYFAAYSSSKFALRGFSEALRRELADSNVGVTYIAPRAVKTSANSEAVYQMAAATKMNMDEPDEVAQFIVDCIIKDKQIAYYGWPEKLFVRINALLPKFVDNAVKKQNQIMARFAPKA